MKKRIISFFVCALCLFLMLSVFVSAEGPARLVDEADILTDSEEAELTEKLDSVSVKNEADVVIVTVNSTGDLSPMEYADDYFDYNGYGQGEGRDGVLFLIDMGAREMWISTSGLCIDAIGDYEIEYIFDSMSIYIEDEDYEYAFNRYIDECDYYIDGYKNGYETDYFALAVASIGFGIIVSLIATSVMKKKLKSVAFQSEAANYVKKGSMNVSLSNDLFLYKTVTRIKKEKESSSGSSTHTSSSGRTHGGGGRSF